MVLAFLSSSLIAQDSLHLSKYILTKGFGINNLESYYTIKDTVQDQQGDYIINVQWLNSEIVLRIPLPPEEQRKLEGKLIAKLGESNKKVDTALLQQVYMEATQNCHSYALQKYWSYYKVDTDLFSSTTRLFNEDMQKVLNSAFKKIDSFDRKAIKKKKYQLNNKEAIIIVFRNKYDSPIHSLFYENQTYYSKNGMLKERTYSKLKALLKERYFDTQTIEAYTIDETKFTNFLNTQK